MVLSRLCRVAGLLLLVALAAPRIGLARSADFPPPPTPDAVADAAALGALLEALHRPTEALELYESLVRMRPDSREGWLGRARVLETLGDRDRAEVGLREALASWPGDALIAGALRDLLRVQGRLAEAETFDALAGRVVRAGGPAPARHAGDAATAVDVAVGQLLADAGRRDEAYRRFEAVLKVSPCDIRALSGLARLDLESGDLTRAEARYRELASVAPTLAEARYGLADTLRLQGRVTEAELEAWRAVQLRPDHPWPRLLYAHLLAWQDRSGEALQHARRAVELDPGIAMAWEELGYTSLRTNHVDAAEEAYAAARGISGQSAFLAREMALVRSLQRRFDEADALFRRSLELAPGDARTFENYGWFLADRGRLEEAEAMLRRVADSPSSRPGLAGMPLAWFYGFTGRSALGRKEVIATLAHAGSLDDVLVAAHVLLNLGYAPEAEVVLRNVLERVPGQDFAVSLLARSLRAQGRRDELVRLLAPLLRDPPGPGAAPADLVRRADVHALLGEAAPAAAWVERARRAGYGARPDESYTLACVLALAGDIDAGLEQLEASLDAGYRYLAGVRLDLDIAALRADPRFAKLVSRYVMAYPMEAGRLD